VAKTKKMSAGEEALYEEYRKLMEEHKIEPRNVEQWLAYYRSPDSRLTSETQVGKS